MLVSFCQRFLAGRLFFPLTIAVTVFLAVSLILQSLVIAGCSTTSPAIRNLELLELSYSPKTAAASFLPDLLKSAKGNSGDFHKLRVGYRGICVSYSPKSSSDASWTCTSSPDLDLGKDPLHVLAAAKIYKDHIATPFFHFAAAICAAVAFLAVLLHATPLLPRKELVRKVAAAAALTGATLSVGAMTLQHVTTNAVLQLVNSVSLGGVDVDVGTRALVCGWAGFATLAVAALGLGVLVVGDWGFRKAERKETEMADKAVRGLTGGRVDLEAARGFGDEFSRPDSGYSGGAAEGKGRFPIKTETVREVASVAKKVHDALKR